MKDFRSVRRSAEVNYRPLMLRARVLAPWERKQDLIRSDGTKPVRVGCEPLTPA